MSAREGTAHVRARNLPCVTHSRLPLLLSVTSARESAARDSAAIALGVPSRALMQRAGAAAAGEIARTFGAELAHGVVVFAGPGNNGGDGWVVARCLAAAGVSVHVIATGDPSTEDSRAERALAQPGLTQARPANARVIVDAMLGTGAGGKPRGAITAAIQDIARARAAGAAVVSLDLPTGVDADTGEAEGAVRADVTITFGTMKRGLLIARGNAGRIALVDIGLPPGDASTPELVTPAWVREVIPPIPADAHKGVRRKLVIVGGQLGMAGAAVFAARAAMRSGIGMVRVVVARESVPIVQAAAPHAIARAWPGERPDDMDDAILHWADGVLIGPGLGDSPQSRALVERVLRAWRGPVVVDADGLNVFNGEAAKLGALLAGRPALLTPHAMELSRLYGANPQEVLVRRFDIAGELARVAHATVLLKGVPTVV
ncbi:MAG: NAD(P)H-hydrate epimerase, partial [Gemmatimonadaceae bacterium]